MTWRFAILASGRGSNAAALIAAFRSGFIAAHLAGVLSDRPQAAVLQLAAQAGLATCCLPRGKQTRAAHEAQLHQQLATWQVDHLLLAGYMRLLSAPFVEHFAGRILNIHPALLPEFAGLQAAERQIRAGRTVMGATVHVVDAGVDSGPIVLQGSRLCAPTENTAQRLSRLRSEVEHVLYPRAVRLYMERLQGARPAATA